MPVKERLKSYIKLKGISNRMFCRTIGVSETYVNSMRSSIQPDKLEIITKKYPDLNPEWLLTGNGEMLRDAMPPIEKQDLVELGADIFKDKLIKMFKDGEIYSGTIVLEQLRLIADLSKRNEDLARENESLKILLTKYGIKYV